MRKRQAWRQQEGWSAENCMQEYGKRIDAAATRHVEESRTHTRPGHRLQEVRNRGIVEQTLLELASVKKAFAWPI